MALTGPAPFAGYPDYENWGDADFDNNQYARLSGDYSGAKFTSGGGLSIPMPVGCRLACDSRFLSRTYGPAGTGLFPWGRDTLGMEGYASAPWVLSATWTIRRLSFDGILPGVYPSVTDPSYKIIASDTAPNGWTMSLTGMDVVAAFQGASFSTDTLGNFGSNALHWANGTYTFNSPPNTLYGQYQFDFQCRYLLTQAAGPYRPPVANDLHATLSFAPYTQVRGVIQTGAAHLTITNDPDFPAPGTLTGSNGVYTYTGTGPVFNANAPRVPHKLLDIQVTIDAMPSETTYLGPRLLSPVVFQPPGNGTAADLAAYKASHLDPDREPGAMVDYGSVLLPADPPNGPAVYRWKLTAPFYAGQSTIFFVPVTYFGPQYKYTQQPGDINDFSNGEDGFTRTIYPPVTPRLFQIIYELGLVPPFVAQLSVNITPTGGSTVPKNNALGVTPDLLGHPSRHYNRAVSALNSNGTATSGVLFWRSIRAIPLLNAFAGGVVWDTPGPGIFVTSAVNDNTPSLAEDARGLLYCLFNRPAQGAMITRSDDDGDTWNTPVMAIPGGARPVLVSSEGHMICAAMTTTGTAPNLIHHITAVYRGPGDAVFGTPYPFQFLSGGTFAPLSVADDSIGMAFTDEGAGRLGLHVLMAGESTTSDWWSADNGATWTRIPLV